MAAVQRWSRNRGWAAAFQSAEVVGEHFAANRGGVAIAGPQHISSSVPTELEAMLEEAAVLAPEGLEHPLQYLQSRILARHIHAMLAILGANLWLLEVLAACILYFDGPWIATGDWNMEPNELSLAGWLDTVNGKVFASSAATCAGGAGAVLDCFVLSEAVAHLVQQVEVVDNTPTTPHWPVRLTLKVTSWGHIVLARKRPKPFPTEVPVGPQRQEEHVDWTWAAEEPPADLELAWLEWLRAAEAAWCRIHDLCGTQRRPHLGRSKGLVIEHVSLGQATRKDTRKSCSKEGRGVALAASFGGPGRGQPGCLEEGADLPAHVPTVSSHGCLNFVAPPWPLGPRLRIHRRLWHTPSIMQVTHAMLFTTSHTQQAISAAAVPIRRVVAGNGRRKLARVLREQRMASPRLASTSAMAMGWLGRSSWSSKWRLGCRFGWIRAESMPSSLPTRRIWDCPCQDLHSKRSTTCARHTSTPLDWVTTASTPRLSCSCQSNCERACSWPSRQRWSNLCAGLT